MIPRVREDNEATFSRERGLLQRRAARPLSPHILWIELPCPYVGGPKFGPTFWLPISMALTFPDQSLPSGKTSQGFPLTLSFKGFVYFKSVSSSLISELDRPFWGSVLCGHLTLLCIQSQAQMGRC